MRFAFRCATGGNGAKDATATETAETCEPPRPRRGPLWRKSATQQAREQARSFDGLGYAGWIARHVGLSRPRAARHPVDRAIGRDRERDGAAPIVPSDAANRAPPGRDREASAQAAHNAAVAQELSDQVVRQAGGLYCLRPGSCHFGAVCPCDAVLAFPADAGAGHLPVVPVK